MATLHGRYAHAEWDKRPQTSTIARSCDNVVTYEALGYLYLLTIHVVEIPDNYVEMQKRVYLNETLRCWTGIIPDGTGGLRAGEAAPDGYKTFPPPADWGGYPSSEKWLLTGYTKTPSFRAILGQRTYDITLNFSVHEHE